MSLILALGGLLGVKGRFQALAGYAAAFVATIALCGALWLGFTLWLAAHDRAVIKADRQLAWRLAIERVTKATEQANQQQGKRHDDFQKSLDQTGSGDDPAAYLCRLRAAQTGNSTPAC